MYTHMYRLLLLYMYNIIASFVQLNKSIRILKIILKQSQPDFIICHRTHGVYAYIISTCGFQHSCTDVAIREMNSGDMYGKRLS